MSQIKLIMRELFNTHYRGIDNTPTQEEIINPTILSIQPHIVSRTNHHHCQQFRISPAFESETKSKRNSTVKTNGIHFERMGITFVLEYHQSHDNKY